MSNTPLRRTAIIDLGSNSARVIVMGFVAGERFHLEDELREIVRLREGMTGAGLSEAAMERGLLTLRLFKRFCDVLGVDTIIGTATSAVREAANGALFLERVQRETGLSLRILSGEDEARFGVLGALGAVCLPEGVILDIGGGSAQVSQIAGNRFLRGEALTLGALALTERFVQTDPIKKGELQAVKREISRQLDGVEWLARAKGPLVGLGGTIRNLAKIAAARENFRLESINGFALSQAALDETIQLLVELPLAGRCRIPGLVRDRADIILPGALVLQSLMQRLGEEEVKVSEFGLREGLFFNHFWEREPSRAAPNLREFSVWNLARYHGFQKSHARHVAFLAGRLFEQLQPLHGYGAPERELLGAAAILHDIGMSIKYADHHKYSQTLIIANALPGFSPCEVALVGLLARYHRKGTPSAGEFAPLLKDGDELRLLRLSAVLRVAEYLERGRSRTVRDVRVTLQEKSMQLTLVSPEETTIELWAARKNATNLLEIAFNRSVIWSGEKNTGEKSGENGSFSS